MNDVIYRAVDNSMTENEIRYEVYVDEHDLSDVYHRGGSFDFGDENANEEYRKRFVDEELCSFGVVAKKVCKCCNSWSEVDSLWGLHEESAEKALLLFKEQYAV